MQHAWVNDALRDRVVVVVENSATIKNVKEVADHHSSPLSQTPCPPNRK